MSIPVALTAAISVDYAQALCLSALEAFISPQSRLPGAKSRLRSWGHRSPMSITKISACVTMSGGTIAVTM